MFEICYHRKYSFQRNNKITKCWVKFVLFRVNNTVSIEISQVHPPYKCQRTYPNMEKYSQNYNQNVLGYEKGNTLLKTKSKKKYQTSASGNPFEL